MSQKGRISESQAIALDEDRAARRRENIARFTSAVSAYAAKQRANSSRKNARTDYNGPTPERAAKAEHGIQQIYAPIGHSNQLTGAKAHRIVDPLEHYRSHIPRELVDAGVRLITDFITAEAGPRVTGTYSGTPGGVAGARHGGVADHIRGAQATVSLIRAEWAREFQLVVDWVLTGLVQNQDGSPLTLADLGRRISPWTRGEKDSAIGYGMFYMTLVLAARFYQRQRALGRLSQPPDPLSVKLLLREGSARMQAQRERLARLKAAEERIARGQGTSR